MTTFFSLPEDLRMPRAPMRRFMEVRGRVANEEALDRLIEQWTMTKGKARILAGLTAVGVPCALVRALPDVIADPHLHARKGLREIDHPDYGTVVVPTSPLCFDGLERTIRWPSRPLGADQDLLNC